MTALKRKLGRPKGTLSKVLKPERIIVIPAAAQAPAANTDAVATLPQFTGRQWDLFSISWSYSAAPAVGSYLEVQWTDANSTIQKERYYIAAGGPGQLNWFPPLTMPADVAPTVTLKAGGSGIFGTVYVRPQKR